MDVGGAKAEFALNAKGRGRIPGCSFVLRPGQSGGPARFKLKLSGPTLSSAWYDEGVDPAATKTDAPISMMVEIGLDGRSYIETFAGYLTSKAQKKASFR